MASRRPGVVAVVHAVLLAAVAGTEVTTMPGHSMGLKELELRKLQQVVDAQIAE
eukprot:evm.model.scf_253EXC.9 EVM.evm.TU.scf_253EXC.9   scf_253EXC:74462-76095(+)